MAHDRRITRAAALVPLAAKSRPAAEFDRKENSASSGCEQMASGSGQISASGSGFFLANEELKVDSEWLSPCSSFAVT
jgi:hypothetical protein